MLQHTPTSDIEPTYKRLCDTFHSGATLPLAYRRRQLLQLARMIQDNQTALEEAIFADLGKAKQEAVMSELAPIVSSALQAVDKLEEWNKVEKPEVHESWRSGWDTTIYIVPKGVCLIISPWNYPYILSLCPLVGALAAGCAAVLKPSELSPATSTILARLVPKYLDPNAYAVVNGAVPETSALINLKWNHIVYTGGIRVGRLIAAAAAKNVTPVTLELGGKSPAFVDESTDMEVAARRILFGKQQNSGQLCVTPDYVLVPRHKKAELIAGFEKANKAFWPDGALAPTSHIGKIVNPGHHTRLTSMLKNTKGKIVIGGQIEGDKRIAPTIVDDVPLDDVLMEDELFGPILPIVPVDDVEDALRVIRERPYPLVLYCFTESEDVRHKFVTRTNSGTLVFNDTFSQLAVHEIPFGGHGDSGYGSWNGKHSFDTFVHRRGSTNVPIAADPHLAFRYPPYNNASYEMFAGAVKQPIPEF
ncbi:aldehyde dehydrogenase [Heliocybe sulcata]|uniref:Aldehyde dehydrogenase n=1 Tax=Heliocybe sulcata TaxID=5364 RepID=A0A5C3MZ36_9AGAM|nr:aldehyde dehydrogenase [Heliocybe sulcata]